MEPVTVYNQAGTSVGTHQLNPAIFGVKINPAVVHQVVVAQQANARPVLASTKDRSQVSGGGKKPWRQKGTGRARHGSIRSPLWRGGGVTFGPTSARNFKVKVNKKMRRKALLMALSSRAIDQRIILLDTLQLSAIKTKEVARLLENLTLRPSRKKAAVKTVESKTKTSPIKAAAKPTKSAKKTVLVILPANDATIVKSVRNIPGVSVITAASLNVLSVLQHQYLLAPLKALETIDHTFLARA